MRKFVLTGNDIEIEELSVDGGDGGTGVGAKQQLWLVLPEKLHSRKVFISDEENYPITVVRGDGSIYSCQNGFEVADHFNTHPVNDDNASFWLVNGEFLERLNYEPKIILPIHVTGLPRNIAEQVFDDQFYVFWKGTQQPFPVKQGRYPVAYVDALGVRRVLTQVSDWVGVVYRLGVTHITGFGYGGENNINKIFWETTYKFDEATPDRFEVEPL